MKRILLTAVAVAFLTTGCGETAPNIPNAERGDVNDAPADIGTMPDGFSDFASKCDGPNRVYVVDRKGSAYAALAVVPNDPRCTGKQPEAIR